METNISGAVDLLGKIKAELADLKARETELKNILIEAGFGKYDGELFAATVYNTDRDKIDQDALLARLEKFYGPSKEGQKAFKEFVAYHTSTTSYPSVRVAARK